MEILQPSFLLLNMFLQTPGFCLFFFFKALQKVCSKRNQLHRSVPRRPSGALGAVSTLCPWSVPTPTNTAGRIGPHSWFIYTSCQVQRAQTVQQEHSVTSFSLLTYIRFQDQYVGKRKTYDKALKGKPSTRTWQRSLLLVQFFSFFLFPCIKSTLLWFIYSPWSSFSGLSYPFLF